MAYSSDNHILKNICSSGNGKCSEENKCSEKNQNNYGAKALSLWGKATVFGVFSLGKKRQLSGDMIGTYKIMQA